MVSKGLKRRNFFEDATTENLHLKDKYGRKGNNLIAHDQLAPSYATTQPPGYNRKNIGATFAP